MVPAPNDVQSFIATETSSMESSTEYYMTTFANFISSALTSDKSTETPDVITTVSGLTTSWITNLTTAAIEFCTPPESWLAEKNQSISSSYNGSRSYGAVLFIGSAYHEFPPDAFTNAQRANGGFLVHFLVVLYMFVALAIVCDDYFVTSLDKICEKLGFSEDVAGATFMAAGSSAPELFTAIIGVFVTKGDVGVGTIVGSAVFNILFVIGLCGLLAGQVVVLSWWPMCRDSAYYALAVLVLILVVYDGEVTWYESLIMLVMYGLYIVLMRFNVPVQAWVVEKVHQLRNVKHVKMMNGAVLKTMRTDYEAFEDEDDDVFSDHLPSPIAMKKPPEMAMSMMKVDEYVKNTRFNITFSEGGFMILLRAKHLPAKTRFRHAAWLVISYRQRMLKDDSYSKRQKFKSASNRLSVVSYTKSARSWFSMTYEPAENFDQWKQKPNQEEGYLALVKWISMYPIRIALFYTIPDCRKARWEKYFMATFLLSILWIAIFSYITVWMVTLIGFTFAIPDSVMGITFLAAGTSIPDAMASVFVAKQGMGDMAVSNSIGSNVFDILLGLSLPWFIKTAMSSPGSVVHINSNGMLYSIILLFLTVLIAVGAIRASGWTLTKKNSILCLIVYAIYLAISSMTECNVFGYVNPPMCKE